MIRLFVLSVLGFALTTPAYAKVKTVKIQNLSTMGADIFPSRVSKKSTYTHGEWGFAALIEIETESGQKKQILFDTGAYPETVLSNVKKLEVDFKPDNVIVSHFHQDHIGGLEALKRAYPQALNKVHVGKYIYASRKEVNSKGELGTKEQNGFIAESDKYRAIARKKGAEAQVLVYENSTVLKEIDEDVMLVYRPTSKRFNDSNTVGNSYRYLGEDEKYHEDDLPEELSLVINTKEGLIVISGCAHRGLLNTVDATLVDTEQISHGSYSKNIFALVGGFHLLASDKKNIPFEGASVPYNTVIATMLQRWKTKVFWGAHCTGHQATESVLQAMKKNPNAKLSDGFAPEDPVKIVEGRSGQSFTYDGTAIPKLDKGFYR